MSDEQDNDLRVEGLGEAAGTVMAARGQQKNQKRNRYLMERICQLRDEVVGGKKAHPTNESVYNALGINVRTFYRIIKNPEFAQVQEKYQNKKLENRNLAQVLSASDALEEFRNECKVLLKDCADRLKSAVCSQDERLSLQAIMFAVEQVAALQAKSPDEMTSGMLDSLDKLTDMPQ